MKKVLDNFRIAVANGKRRAQNTAAREKPIIMRRSTALRELAEALRFWRRDFTCGDSFAQGQALGNIGYAWRLGVITYQQKDILNNWVLSAWRAK